MNPVNVKGDKRTAPVRVKDGHTVANVLKAFTAENGNNGSKWQDNDQCFCPLNLSEVLQPNHIHSESFEGFV